MHAVRLNRSAHAPTELVSTKRRLLHLKNILGVERLVAKELEDISPEVVRAGFGDHLDDTGGCQSVLRLILYVADFEFLDGIFREILARFAILRPVVDHA